MQIDIDVYLKLAEKAGVSRESLYRMMSETGNPRYSSLEGLLGALGFEQKVVPKKYEVEKKPKHVKT